VQLLDAFIEIYHPVDDGRTSWYSITLPSLRNNACSKDQIRIMIASKTRELTQACLFEYIAAKSDSVPNVK
jgi:hypothetical protein